MNRSACAQAYYGMAFYASLKRCLRGAGGIASDLLAFCIS